LLKNGGRKIKISIVVLTKNEEQNIENCLASLYNQKNFRKNEYEVIVVDGYSTDNTLSLASKFPVKIFLENRNTFGYARNIGIKQAKGDVIIFMSADSIASPELLSKCYKTFKDKTMVCVMGEVKPLKGETIWARIRSKRMKINALQLKHKKHITWREFSTKLAAFRKEIFRMTGFFNEQLPATEDKELAFRLEENGFKILYNPEIICYHLPEDNIFTIIKKFYKEYLGIGRMIRYHNIKISVLELLPLPIYALNNKCAYSPFDKKSIKLFWAEVIYYFCAIVACLLGFLRGYLR